MSEAAVGFLLMGLSVALIFALIVYVIQAIAYWKLFPKFGEPGWKGLIPVYNTYVLYDRFWESKWFWVSILASVMAGGVSLAPGSVSIAGVISSIASIASILLRYLLCKKVAQAFGKGIGFMLGLMFLQPVFMLILGFGDAVCQEDTDEWENGD